MTLKRRHLDAEVSGDAEDAVFLLRDEEVEDWRRVTAEHAGRLARHVRVPQTQDAVHAPRDQDVLVLREVEALHPLVNLCRGSQE